MYLGGRLNVCGNILYSLVLKSLNICNMWQLPVLVQASVHVVPDVSEA